MIAKLGRSGIAARMKKRRRPKRRPSRVSPILSEMCPITGEAMASRMRATAKISAACPAPSPQNCV
jgi:hypothetical protein